MDWSRLVLTAASLVTAPPAGPVVSFTLLPLGFFLSPLSAPLALLAQISLAR